MEENNKPIAVFYAYDASDVDMYAQCSKMYAALSSITEELRRRYKYTETKPADWQEVRDIVYECIHNYNVNMDL
jgi:hypothetical protein